jgi:oligoendopeptidase F
LNTSNLPSWDLNDLYAGPDDPALQRDMKETLDRAVEFENRYRGRIASGALSAAEFADAVALIEAMYERIRKVVSYASLVFSADTSQPRHGALYQSAREQATALREHLTFFEIEWAKLPDDRTTEYLTAPELARYRHYLEVERRMAPHRLSEPEELVLDAKANTGVHAFERLFDETMSHARFVLAHGRTRQTLSEQEILSRLHVSDRTVRKAAARGLSKGLAAQSHLLTYVFNVVVADHAGTDRLRKFATPMAERHLSNEIDQPAVDALMEAVETGHGLVQRYYRLKRRVVGVETLFDYDRYAPISLTERTVDWKASREIVLSAFGAFSPRMREIASLFFERRWIDAAIRPGKRGGAFSHGTVPSAHPYVLVNYAGTPRDVMTVAHELGHGVHQYLSRGQGCLQADTPLTMAETASVFGEMLVFKALQAAETDPERALALVCGKIEDSCSTIFRQVALTRFEQTLHAARRREGELTTARINELWMAANREMFGDSVVLTDDYALWWSYIPHFIHSPFYCYAYAFGALLVFALYRRYLDEGQAFVPKYLDLLAAGGSDAPERLLAKAGVDITERGFWGGGIEVLKSWVDDAEQLAAQRTAPRATRTRRSRS